MVEEKDQDLEESTEEAKEETTEETVEEPETTEAETKEEQSKETEPEPTIKETYDLARALQKGYTLTRQQLGTISGNQEKIQGALEKIATREPQEDLDEPLTVGKLLDINKRQAEARTKTLTDKKEKVDTMVADQIANLTAEGVIKNQEDEDSLLKYALKHEIKDLSRAATQWTELMEAQRTGEKVKAKNKVKQEAGSKVGTSIKTKTEKSNEIDYNEIHHSDMDELIGE